MTAIIQAMADRVAGLDPAFEIDTDELSAPLQAGWLALDNAGPDDNLGAVLGRELEPFPEGDAILKKIFALVPGDPGGQAQGSNGGGIDIAAVLSDYPRLPEYARLTPEQNEEAQRAGAWLDRYVEFASEASPMTPAAFHVAAGLFLGSLAIARRLYLSVSVKENSIYPNLYMLYIGPSTVQRKSTAMRVARGLIKAAGLEHFLLADQQTPEAMALDLTTRFPSTYTSWQPRVQERWLKERSLAAKRGWLLEEAGKLLASFNRDFTAGLLPMVLKLYECEDEAMTANTISRGRELVEDVYLSIFGATTYGDMSEHLKTPRLWRNGFFARFALVGSDDVGEWRFWPEPKVYPAELIKGLRRVATELLPLPDAYIDEIEIPSSNGGDPRKIQKIELVTPFTASRAQMGRGGEAWRAWERYSQTVGFDIIKDDRMGEKFKASYGRLGTMLLKVALILAAFDAQRLPVAIEPRHIYRAQQIVEEWRKNLHQIFGKLDAIDHEDDLAHKVKVALAKAGGAWVTRRDLLRGLGVRVMELEPALEDLEARGAIEKEKVTDKPGPASYQYRIVTD